MGRGRFKVQRWVDQRGGYSKMRAHFYRPKVVSGSILSSEVGWSQLVELCWVHGFPKGFIHQSQEVSSDEGGQGMAVPGSKKKLSGSGPATFQFQPFHSTGVLTSQSDSANTASLQEFSFTTTSSRPSRAAQWVLGHPGLQNKTPFLSPLWNLHTKSWIRIMVCLSFKALWRGFSSQTTPRASWNCFPL